MATSTPVGTRVSELTGLGYSENMRIAEYQIRRFTELLHSLDMNDWDKITDCDPWTVRDIVAHLVGWMEWLTSPAAVLRQAKDTRRLRAQHGDKLDAQNEAQVRSRRDLAPVELIERFEAGAKRSMRVRRVGVTVGRALPLVAGPVGFTHAGFVLGQIFTRDQFMHRIDITRATGKELVLGPDDRRLVADIVRHWVRDARPHARLELSGRAGDSFVCGETERAVIRGDAIEFCRLMAGRAEPSVMEAEGDEAAARRWLEVTVPF